MLRQGPGGVPVWWRGATPLVPPLFGAEAPVLGKWPPHPRGFCSRVTRQPAQAPHQLCLPRSVLLGRTAPMYPGIPGGAT